MNKILSFFALFFCVGALAGEPFFCTKAGTKLYYERYDALLPADAKPGDVLPDASCKVSMGLLSVTIDVTVRQVIR